MTPNPVTRLFGAALLAACPLLSTTALGQVVMEKNDINIYAKVGLVPLQAGKFNKQDYNNADQKYRAQTPFLALGFDLGLFKNFTLGLVGGYSKFHSDEAIPKSSEHYTGDIKAINLFVTVKYYLPVTFGKISPYIHSDLLGLTAYTERRYIVRPGQAPDLIDPSLGITENYGLYAGANYQLTPHISALAELGYGYTMLNVGLNYSIKH